MRRIGAFVFPLGAFAIPFLAGIGHSRFSLPHYRFGSQNSMGAYAGYGLLHLLSAHVAGIPDEINGRPAMSRTVFSALGASAGATAVWAAIQTVFPGLLPRQVVFVTGMAMFLFSVLSGALHSRIAASELQGERVTAILGPAEASSFSADVAREFPIPEKTFTLVSILEDADLLRTTPQELSELVRVDTPTTIVLSDTVSNLPVVIDTASELHRAGVKIRTVPSFYNEFFGKVALHDLSRMSMLFDVRTVHHVPYRRLKRVLDFIGALTGLIVFALLLPFAVVGNLIGNRGPLLYRQTRIGERGEPFTIYKFRTMVTDSFGASEHPKWTSADDPRITPFGKIMRRAHVDELPQFWNILRGEMSLVGPRPEQQHYVEELRAKEPAYELRHLVRPGLTGWAQIKFRYAASEGEAIEKLQYDLYYVQHQSLTLDLAVLARTASSVLRRRGQ